MTQKTGQKCTAIRRVLVPTERLGDLRDAMIERLSALKVGDPADEANRMGPVATAQQKTDVLAGIARLAGATDEVFGGLGESKLDKGFFVGPVVRSTQDPLNCAPLNEHEVFGPVSTLGAYDGTAATAAAFIARGEGCLVSSAYSDDRAWVSEFVGSAGAWAGRLFLGSTKMAAQSPGPGTVLALPSCTVVRAARVAARSSAASAACTTTCSAAPLKAMRASSSPCSLEGRGPFAVTGSQRRGDTEESGSIGVPPPGSEPFPKSSAPPRLRDCVSPNAWPASCPRVGGNATGSSAADGAPPPSHPDRDRASAAGC